MKDQALATGLAICGGEPLRQRPFAPWPVYSPAAKEAVLSVLDSGKTNYWNGNKGREFQERFAAYCGARYGIAVNSGTSALHIALAAAGVGPGDEVIVPATTFIATATSVLNQNAIPVFADIDPRTCTISPESVEACITERTRAVIAVHLYGHPCDMDAIRAIADRHGLIVIEDAAQAQGAEVRGRRAGSLGHLAAFSFCQEKIFSTGGEGGMVTTSDPEMARIAASVRDHGFDEEERRRLKREGSLNLYFHHRAGYNFRLTEMQSALGLVALDELPENLDRRRRNALALTEQLSSIPQITRAVELPETRHAFYQYPAAVAIEELRVDRDTFVKAVRAEGIPIALGNTPENYREEVFTRMDAPAGYSETFCPNAAEMGKRTFKLKVHPTLTPEDMEDTARAIEKVLTAYAR